MEEEQANGLYWEEIRQTVAGISAFPEHCRAEVPGGRLVLSVLNLSVGAGTGITFFLDPQSRMDRQSRRGFGAGRRSGDGKRRKGRGKEEIR